jgi:membrane dipeptidase
VMITFMPQYLTERARAQAGLVKQERARLEKANPDAPEKVKAGVEAWEAAHPLAHAATLSDVADHIDHVRKVAGIDHVGIGGDYEGFDGPPEGLEDVSCYPALLAELMARGYTKEEIEKVAGLNVLRVLRGAEEAAGKPRSEKR